MERNDNLESQKSTAAPREEAKEEKKRDAKQARPLTDNQTDEIKSRHPVLPEDAELKAKLSQEDGI